MSVLIVRNGETHRARRPSATPFGSLLKQHLAERGLSQSRFAEAIGVDHSYVSRLCSGGRAPSREVALVIARDLGLDEAAAKRLLHAAGFVAGGETASATPLLPEVAALNDAINRCPNPASREAALRLVAAMTELLG